jgi:hypothetical protein
LTSQRSAHSLSTRHPPALRHRPTRSGTEADATPSAPPRHGLARTRPLDRQPASPPPPPIPAAGPGTDARAARTVLAARCGGCLGTRWSHSVPAGNARPTSPSTAAPPVPPPAQPRPAPSAPRLLPAPHPARRTRQAHPPAHARPAPLAPQQNLTRSGRRRPGQEAQTHRRHGTHYPLSLRRTSSVNLSTQGHFHPLEPVNGHRPPPVQGRATTALPPHTRSAGRRTAPGAQPG